MQEHVRVAGGDLLDERLEPSGHLLVWEATHAARDAVRNPRTIEGQRAGEAVGRKQRRERGGQGALPDVHRVQEKATRPPNFLSRT
eukprot:2049897-Prymnesium_polylepis.1